MSASAATSSLSSAGIHSSFKSRVDQVLNLRDNYEQCLLLLLGDTAGEKSFHGEALPHNIPASRRVIFPADAPLEGGLSCLELALLKQLPRVSALLAVAVVGMRSGAALIGEAASSQFEVTGMESRSQSTFSVIGGTEARARGDTRTITTGPSLTRALLFSLVAQNIPATISELLAKSIYLNTSPSHPQTIDLNEVWPSRNQLAQIDRLCHEYKCTSVQKDNTSSISEDKLGITIEDMRGEQDRRSQSRHLFSAFFSMASCSKSRYTSFPSIFALPTEQWLKLGSAIPTSSIRSLSKHRPLFGRLVFKAFVDIVDIADPNLCYNSDNDGARVDEEDVHIDLLLVAMETRDESKYIPLLQRSCSQPASFPLPALLLHYAVYFDVALPVLSALSAHGSLNANVDINAHTYFHLYQKVVSPIEVSVKKGSLDSTKALLNYGAQVSLSLLVDSCRQNAPTISSLLIDTICNSNKSSIVSAMFCQHFIEPFNQTILSLICSRGQDSPDMINLVLQILEISNEGYIDVLDDFGFSCLDYAMAQGCRQLVRILLDWKLNKITDAVKRWKIDRSASKLGKLVRKFLLRRRFHFYQ